MDSIRRQLTFGSISTISTYTSDDEMSYSASELDTEMGHSPPPTADDELSNSASELGNESETSRSVSGDDDGADSISTSSDSPRSEDHSPREARRSSQPRHYQSAPNSPLNTRRIQTLSTQPDVAIDISEASHAMLQRTNTEIELNEAQMQKEMEIKGCAKLSAEAGIHYIAAIIAIAGCFLGNLEGIWGGIAGACLGALIGEVLTPALNTCCRVVGKKETDCKKQRALIRELYKKNGFQIARAPIATFASAVFTTFVVSKIIDAIGFEASNSTLAIENQTTMMPSFDISSTSAPINNTEDIDFKLLASTALINGLASTVISTCTLMTIRCIVNYIHKRTVTAFSLHETIIGTYKNYKQDAINGFSASPTEMTSSVASSAVVVASAVNASYLLVLQFAISLGTVGTQVAIETYKRRKIRKILLERTREAAERPEIRTDEAARQAIENVHSALQRRNTTGSIKRLRSIWERTIEGAISLRHQAALRADSIVSARSTPVDIESGLPTPHSTSRPHSPIEIGTTVEPQSPHRDQYIQTSVPTSPFAPLSDEAIHPDIIQVTETTTTNSESTDEDEESAPPVLQTPPKSTTKMPVNEEPGLSAHATPAQSLNSLVSAGATPNTSVEKDLAHIQEDESIERSDRSLAGATAGDSELRAESAVTVDSRASEISSDSTTRISPRLPLEYETFTLYLKDDPMSENREVIEARAEYLRTQMDKASPTEEDLNGLTDF